MVIQIALTGENRQRPRFLRTSALGGITRQQAIDYEISPSEVDRYVVNPGQACSYMIGPSLSTGAPF